MVRWNVKLLSCTLVALALCSPALAGPPSYLLLRQTTSPGPQHQAGYPAAQYYDARTYGYAYGWFGAAPRTHLSRHFGVNRMYTQYGSW
jgi:hypothetical protein